MLPNDPLKFFLGSETENHILEVNVRIRDAEEFSDFAAHEWPAAMFSKDALELVSRGEMP